MSSYKISKLQVKNFRNLQHDIIEFSPHINCILGKNGNGKTNILEAVYLLATRKSFRKNAGFPQFLGIDGEKPEIIFSSVLKVGDRESLSYTGKLREGHSQWFCEGKASPKKLEIPIVFINPFDSYGFHTLALHRRAWFDRHISMLNGEYKKTLGKYKQFLRFRNTLLGERPPHYRKQIIALDRELSACSKILTSCRIDFLVEIELLCDSIFKQIFSKEQSLHLRLETRGQGFSEEDFFDMMQKRFSVDESARITTYGIHKDDYTLLLGGLSAFEYSSLGQQKMSYLGLLFAYIELFRYKMKTFPIVLIDDVSGELDKVRWERLVGLLERSDFQVLITTANERFKEELEKIVGINKLLVQSGSVEQVFN